MIKEFVDVKIFSGRGGFSIYKDADKKHLRMIKCGLKERNRNLRRAGYPQRWSFEIMEVKPSE